MTDILIDALKDSVRLIPFLFVTYLVIGILEHAAGSRSRRIIRKAGKTEPIWGSLLGAFPQCGFSAAASYFYMGRVITLGTLIAVYMSTSDEMLPILISAEVAPSTILKLLAVKVGIGMLSGFAAELLLGRMFKKEAAWEQEHEHSPACSCAAGAAAEAVRHTLKVFFFIFLISLAIGTVIRFIGEESLSALFSDIPVLGEAAAGLVGLIPNCAASVAITQLYLEGIIGSGPMMSGLLVSAGMGLLVLFKENRDMRENVTITVVLYIMSVLWGVLIEFFGITF